MVQVPMLKCKAVDGHLVSDAAALEARFRRFYGRAAKHPWDVLPEGCSIPDVHPHRLHARDALRKGELLPLDEYTAKAAGKPWTPEPKDTKPAAKSAGKGEV